MNDSALAPVILFAYKRPKELELTIKALEKNNLTPQSELYVFVDGPKSDKDIPKILQVQEKVNNIKAFKSIHINISNRNIGCADSIINGVTKILNTYNSAIIVEDDIITTPNFLDFMNICLMKYSNNKQVYSVSGYSFPFKQPESYKHDVYFIPRHNPWGWATWADRWHQIDWSINDFNQFMLDKEQQKRFLAGGADVVRMLNRQMQGHLDAWDIRFCYNRFKAEAVTVYPTISKVQNIGFSEEATHTNVYNRYKTQIDETGYITFNLPNLANINGYYHNQYLKQYSLVTRLRNRLKTYIGMK